MSQQEELTGVLQRYFEIIKVPHTEPAKEFLRQCQSYSIKLNDHVYKYYQRGSGPTILLVHGIHSNLGAMVAIAEDLIEEGFKVALFDIPAHGEAVGTTTDPVEVREFIRKIVARLGDIHAVVCHSLGGLWALTAMHNGFPAKKFVSIASPSNKKFIVDKFAQLNQIKNELVEGLVKELENRFGQSMWTEFSPSEIVKTLAMPGLIIHGKNDDFVPPVHAELLQSCWSGAKVEMVEGAGHFEIVGSPKVRRLITAYLQEAH
jgi:pimeloyl-ACP methyl ester carboxylesterase